MSEDYPMAPEGLMAKAEELTKKDKIEVAEASDIRDRLMRRLQTQTIQVEFEDDQGTFNIEVRLLSPAEQQKLSDSRMEFMKLLKDVQGLLGGEAEVNVDPEQILKLEETNQNMFNQIYRLVGDICVDSKLNYDYWVKGVGFGIDVPLRLVNEAYAETQRVRSGVRKFRSQ